MSCNHSLVVQSSRTHLIDHELLASEVEASLLAGKFDNSILALPEVSQPIMTPRFAHVCFELQLFACSHQIPTPYNRTKTFGPIRFEFLRFCLQSQTLSQDMSFSQYFQLKG
jgi:hypothetical protein